MAGLNGDGAWRGMATIFESIRVHPKIMFRTNPGTCKLAGVFWERTYAENAHN